MPDAPNAKRRVVVFDAPSSTEVVADVLRECLGLSRTDALIHARSAPGVLPDRLDPAPAVQLVECLQTKGVSARVVDPAELLDFHACHAVHHVRLLDSGLEIITLRGTADGVIPWGRIRVISTGQVPLEATDRFDWNDEHIFATARRSHHEPHRGKLPPVMELWLVIDGERKPLRLDQTRMNYETLGSAKVDSAAENFRLLLRRLVTAATHAVISPATGAYLDHGSVSDYEFASTHVLQQATQLAALSRQP